MNFLKVIRRFWFRVKSIIMAKNYKTPGIYVEEMPKFPPSVYSVGTAIPAFIGYTEKAQRTEPGDLLNVPARISSLIEYELYFGKGAALSAGEEVNNFYMYNSLRLFFANGGGICFIVSTGLYDSSVKVAGDFTLDGKGLHAIEKTDEVTLLVLPDNTLLSTGNDFYDVYDAALEQCGRLLDRFVIMHVKENDPKGLEFRNYIGIQSLNYGAAYTPWLQINPAGSQKTVTVPPDGAIAGIYAAMDQNRGVWKAPANVSINGIIGPKDAFTSHEQEALNIDEAGGKSINAIRSFAGKGTLVWGARTLAGNDNEWRYVNVRRFFIFVEESVKKATEQYVFEPNEPNTWVKVQAMIENFLSTLWRQGALQGSKPEHAYYVAVGLGKTMTQLDILEGRMIVEIGMAAVRPAEFIILRYSIKMITGQ